MPRLQWLASNKIFLTIAPVHSLESTADLQCQSMPDDAQLDALKLPPHSLEAEQSVLGGLLLDNEAADRVADLISDADFYSEAHRLIYHHIIGLCAESKPADVVTVSEALSSVQKLDYVGGLRYLGLLVE